MHASGTLRKPLNLAEFFYSILNLLNTGNLFLSKLLLILQLSLIPSYLVKHPNNENKKWESCRCWVGEIAFINQNNKRNGVWSFHKPNASPGHPQTTSQPRVKPENSNGYLFSTFKLSSLNVRPQKSRLLFCWSL